MTKTLVEIENANLSNFDILFTMRRFRFNEILYDIFGNNENTNNLGKKYRNLKQNLFENFTEEKLMDGIPSFLHKSAIASMK